jgi:hypothetical protein
VIRSWLLDLLVAALDEDERASTRSAATPRTPARAGGPSRRRSTTPSRCRDRRLALRPVRLPPGRQPGDEGDRGDAQPVRRPRRAHRGANPAATVAEAATKLPPRAVRVRRHLTLHDFRSYADLDVALEPGPRRSSAATARARPTWSRRSTTSRGSPRTGSPATRRWSGPAPSQAIIRAAVVRDGRRRRSRSRSTRASPTGPGQPVAAAPRPRAARPGAHGGLRPEDLTLVKGDPSDGGASSSTTCWCCAHRGWPACGRLRPDPAQRNSLLKTAGAARAGSTRQDGALSTLEVWDEHLARVGAELLAARLRWSTTCAPYVGQGLRHGRPRAGATTPDRVQAVAPSSWPRTGPRRAVDARWRSAGSRPAARRGRAPAQGRARPRRLAGRPAPRRAGALARQR